jgi:hypothetical protein
MFVAVLVPRKDRLIKLEYRIVPCCLSYLLYQAEIFREEDHPKELGLLKFQIRFGCLTAYLSSYLIEIYMSPTALV